MRSSMGVPPKSIAFFPPQDVVHRDTAGAATEPLPQAGLTLKTAPVCQLVAGEGRS